MPDDAPAGHNERGLTEYVVVLRRVHPPEREVSRSPRGPVKGAVMCPHRWGQEWGGRWPRRPRPDPRRRAGPFRVGSSGGHALRPMIMSAWRDVEESAPAGSPTSRHADMIMGLRA